MIYSKPRHLRYLHIGDYLGGETKRLDRPGKNRAFAAAHSATAAALSDVIAPSFTNPGSAAVGGAVQYEMLGGAEETLG